MLTRGLIQARAFASKIMAGSTSNTKDSAGRRLGIKRWGRAEVRPDEILLRQRGLKWHPGNNVHVGKDHTIHAKTEGVIEWSRDRYSYRKRNRIHVVPMETPNRKFPAPKPFAFHPELYPDLAQYNPEPTKFEIPRSQFRRQRNPQVCNVEKVSAGAAPSTVNILQSIAKPTLFKGYRGNAIAFKDMNKIEELKQEMRYEVNKLAGIDVRQDNIIYK